jgi:formate hydrogenlyase subunit 3/multisubunit Na+/H+ antiporter MnhD subunit
MSNTDIDFSDKSSWEHTWRELFTVLGKRILSLPSKVIGFKPLCFFVATWLLINGHIRDWIWFCIVVIVLFGIVGLKVVARWREQ